MSDSLGSDRNSVVISKNSNKGALGAMSKVSFSDKFVLSKHIMILFKKRLCLSYILDSDLVGSICVIYGL